MAVTWGKRFFHCISRCSIHSPFEALGTLRNLRRAGGIVQLPDLSAAHPRALARSGLVLVPGTLVPVVDLVQVGSQSMADRYTYIPYIGLFIMAAWSAQEWLQRRPAMRPLFGGAASALLAACLVLSWIQLGYWHDSIQLFTHALSVTRSNVFSEKNLSSALSEAGRGKEAIPHYEALLKLKPDDLLVRYNFGLELLSADQPVAAANQFSIALASSPNSDKLHNSLGIALAQEGKLDSAGEEFTRAIQLNPQFPWPRLNNGVILQQKGFAKRSHFQLHASREAPAGMG